MSWTSAEDVLNAWIGDNAPSDRLQVERYIASAERKIRREIPSVVDRLASGNEPDLLDTVHDVVTEMVHRVYRNPEGVRQVQETTGPTSGSVTYGGDHPGSLYLTEDNRRALAPVGGRSRAGEVDLIPAGHRSYPLDHAWVNGPPRFAPSNGNPYSSGEWNV